jgi:hypothetical protein
MLEGKHVEPGRTHGAILFECLPDQHVQRLRPAQIGNGLGSLAGGGSSGWRGSRLVGRLIGRGAHARVASRPPSR